MNVLVSCKTNCFHPFKHCIADLFEQELSKLNSQIIRTKMTLMRQNVIDNLASIKEQRVKQNSQE